MNIIIPIEIFIREIHGHLLLASAAASRGHTTYIAHINEIYLLMRLGLIRESNILLKNLYLSDDSTKMYKKFIKNDNKLFVQDQEPPILWSSIDKYVQDYGISRDQYFPFEAVFCWTEEEKDFFTNFFKMEDIFLNTGSPRADFWRLESKNTIKKSLKKTSVLIVSNFGLHMGKRRWQEWISQQKLNKVITSNNSENNFLNFLKEDFGILVDLIIAIKELAESFPEVEFNIRTHPLDDTEYWKRVIRDYPNLNILDSSNTLAYDIASSDLVIQNGCTSAFESAVIGTPCVTYGSPRKNSGLDAVTKFTTNIECLEKLKEAVESLSSPVFSKNDHIQKRVSTKLVRGNSYETILRIMEERGIERKEIISFYRYHFLKLILALKRFLNKIRFLGKANNNITFKKDNIDTIFNYIERINKIAKPRTFLSKNLLIIKPK